MKISRTRIKIINFGGSFADKKDGAAKTREEIILPVLKRGECIVLDYKGVTSTSQSFTHALISEAIRTYGPEVALERILFKNCNENVKRIISIVVEYMQRRLDTPKNRKPVKKRRINPSRSKKRVR